MIARLARSMTVIVLAVVLASVGIVAQGRGGSASADGEGRRAVRSHRLLGVGRHRDWRCRMVTPAKGDYQGLGC